MERNLPELEVNVHFFLTRGYTGDMDSLLSQCSRKKNKTGDRDRKNHGFTLLEAVISIAIIVLLSVQVLSFSSLKEGTSLTRAAQELGFAVRRAQAMALATNVITIGGVVRTNPPPSVAIRLSSNAGVNKSYFFFADFEPQDNKYNGTNECIEIPKDCDEPHFILPGGVFIKAIKLSSGGVIPVANVILMTPEAMMILTDGSGATVAGQQINVILQDQSGATRTIEIHTGGQVTITNP